MTTFSQQVLSIYRAAVICAEQGLPKAAWNTTLHEALYQLAVTSPKYTEQVGRKNITNARFKPKSLRMTDTSGLKMSGKMVDYALVTQPDPEMKSAIRETLHCESKEAQAVNQTMHAPLRMCPIAVSVGTKPPFSEGEAADVQLAIWASAGLTKLGQSLSQDQTISTIPTLAAHGDELHLLALQEKGDENMMDGRLRLGSAETLLEPFQMLRRSGSPGLGKK